MLRDGHDPLHPFYAIVCHAEGRVGAVAVGLLLVAVRKKPLATDGANGLFGAESRQAALGEVSQGSRRTL